MSVLCMPCPGWKFEYFFSPVAMSALFINTVFFFLKVFLFFRQGLHCAGGKQEGLFQEKTDELRGKVQG